MLLRLLKNNQKLTNFLNHTTKEVNTPIFISIIAKNGFVEQRFKLN